MVPWNFNNGSQIYLESILRIFVIPFDFVKSRYLVGFGDISNPEFVLDYLMFGNPHRTPANMGLNFS